MLLIPEQEMLQKAQFMQIDPTVRKTVEMGQKLNNVFEATIPDDIKAKLVSEVLEKLQDFKPKENQNAAVATDVPREETRELLKPFDYKAIIKSMPKTMRTKAENLFDIIGDAIPNSMKSDPSRLATLTKYALTNKSKKAPPDGWQDYVEILHDKNVVDTMVPALKERTPPSSTRKSPIKRDLRNRMMWIPY